ncbi:PKD domain-containing protein [Flavitalea sp.]|nr:PKD domain-containing protein [Flavitalea sp.]
MKILSLIRVCDSRKPVLHTFQKNSSLPKVQRRVVFLFYILLIHLISAQGQVQTARNIAINNYVKGFYEYLPENYDQSGESYPLLIFFHGAGERGNGTTQLSRVLSNGVPKLIKDGTFPKSFTVNNQTHKFIVISPQFTDVPPGNSYVNDIIDYAVKNYRVNTKRIYLTGLSMGGGMIFLYLGVNSDYAKRIAAMVPVCQAYGYSAGTSKVISDAGIHTWMTHNNGDPTVGVAGTLNYLQGINSYTSGLAKATIFTSTSHDAWTKTYDPNFRENGLNVYEWMLQYERGAVVPTNKVPVASAGNDVSISLPENAVTLTGSGKDPDGTISSYSWKKIKGGSAALMNAGSSTTAVNDLVEGVYEFELTVTDNQGATSKDVVQITVKAANKLPRANAGQDQFVALPANSVTLSGTGTDDDGDIATYTWNKLNGGPAEIINSGSVTTLVTRLEAGVYEFELTVTDNAGGKSKDQVKITVNPASNKVPRANAGSDITISLPEDSLTLRGSGNDEDGTNITYLWKKISGGSVTFENANHPVTRVRGLESGIYEFELTVTDNDGAKATDVVRVRVNAPQNKIPVADAGDDLIITLPQSSCNLRGSGQDEDGTIVEYSWRKSSGGSANILSQSAATTLITGLATGIYQFELTVKDNNGSISSDVVQVTVNPAGNKLPIVNAGTDIIIAIPSTSVTLTGNVSAENMSLITILWKKVSGSVASIANAGSAATEVKDLVAGVYEFELSAKDDQGMIATDLIKVTVTPPPNKKPVAFAGSDINITLPTNYVILRGSGTDEDGKILSYSWRKISGGGANIISASLPESEITGLQAGNYTFELTVTDNSMLTDTDEINITVNPASNKNPVANAEADFFINLPVSTITLNGSGTDQDGRIFSYLWQKLYGGSAVILNPTEAVTAVNDLTAGTYAFGLTVTDNSGAIGHDTVIVTVNAAINKSPLANAGEDITVVAPLDKIQLTGSASDEDGIITMYSWKLRSLAKVNIVNVSASETEVEGLTEGSHEFELIVTDDKGAMASDIVVITVLPKPNEKPVANAGSNLNITFGSNNIILDGSLSYDPDGTKISYSWTQISGRSLILLNANSVSPAIIFSKPGTYELMLEVIDSRGATGLDTMSITVTELFRGNRAPVVNAGADIEVFLPERTAQLVGSASDDDGTVVSYKWRMIRGPISYNILETGSRQTMVNALSEGEFEFELSATDDKGNMGRDTMSVSVSKAVSKITIYPNPVETNAILRIEAPVKSPLSTILIYDIYGRLVRSYMISSTDRIIQKELSLGDLKAGTYLIKVNDEKVPIPAIKFIKL